jgi:hypothetical protein
MDIHKRSIPQRFDPQSSIRSMIYDRLVMQSYRLPDPVSAMSYIRSTVSPLLMLICQTCPLHRSPCQPARLTHLTLSGGLSVRHANFSHRSVFKSGPVRAPVAPVLSHVRASVVPVHSPVRAPMHVVPLSVSLSVPRCQSVSRFVPLSVSLSMTLSPCPCLCHPCPCPCPCPCHPRPCPCLCPCPCPVAPIYAPVAPVRAPVAPVRAPVAMSVPLSPLSLPLSVPCRPCPCPCRP